MAFLGGLFGNIKTSDVLVGGAKNLLADIKSSKEDNTTRVNKVADYLIQKQFEQQETFDNDLKDNIKAVEKIRGLSGSNAGAEYLVRTYGIEQALEEATTLKSLNDTFGIKPDFSNPDSVNTVEDIARFATSQPTFLQTPEIKDTSFLSTIGLGRDLQDEVQRKIDASVDSFVFDKPDLGAMPVRGDEGGQNKNLLLDLNAQAGILMRKAMIERDKNGNEEEYKNLMAQAQEIAVHYNLITQGNKPLTENILYKIDRETSNQIVQVSGLLSETKLDGVGGYLNVPKKDDTKNNIKIAEAQSIIRNFIANGKQAGFSTAVLYDFRRKGISENRLPRVNEDGELEFATDVALIPTGLIGGTGAYEINEVEQNGQGSGATATATATDTATGTATGNVPSSLTKSLYSDGQMGKNASQDLDKYRNLAEQLATETDPTEINIIKLKMINIQDAYKGQFDNPVTLED